MDQKTLYTRALSADFLYWLNENKLLKTFKSNPLLNIGMRGNKIIIYYRGAKILTNFKPEKTIDTIRLQIHWNRKHIPAHPRQYSRIFERSDMRSQQ